MQSFVGWSQRADVARLASHLLPQLAETHLGGYIGRKSSMRRRKAFAWVAGVGPMYSWLHGLVCFSPYVVL